MINDVISQAAAVHKWHYFYLSTHVKRLQLAGNNLERNAKKYGYGMSHTQIELRHFQNGGDDDVTGTSTRLYSKYFETFS